MDIFVKDLNTLKKKFLEIFYKLVSLENENPLKFWLSALSSVDYILINASTYTQYFPVWCFSPVYVELTQV